MVCELYMAKNIDALYLIAVENEETKRLKGKKLDALYKAVDKLYKSITQEVSDEEKTYVYMIRFLKLTEYVSNADCDKQFFNLRFQPCVEKVKSLLNTIQSNLIARYANLSEVEKITDSKLNQIVIEPEIKKSIFGADIFVTSKQLFDSFKAKDSILIMDTRPQTAFEESHLKEFLIVNIAEEYIQPGLSAHVLASKLPTHVKQHYNSRDAFEYIVLLDWDTNSKTLLSSKLHTLRVILTEWDVNTQYKNPPYVLNGGYMNFIDMYPTFSTNPHVKYNQKYSELDELLNLDAIQYPTEGLVSSNAYIQVPKSAKPERNVDEMIDQMSNIISKQLKIELDLLDNQIKLYDLEKKMDTSDNSEMNKLTEIKQGLEGEIADLESAKIITDERKNILSKELQPLLSLRNYEKDEGILGKKKLDIERNETKIAEVVRKRRKIVEEHDEKSASPPVIMEEPKPKLTEDLERTTDDNNKTSPVLQHSKAPRPVINRKTKPTSVTQVISTGLTGIVNIRNTCYMNAIIQCFRHIPLVKDFFCKGIYNDYVSNKRDPVIIYETAQLIRNLWSGSQSYVRPMQFYNKIGQLNPVFQEGHHEDCMEFFLILLNHLSEDCSVVVPRDKYNSAKHEAWLYRLSNKTSFFIENFYHQIRTSIHCIKCPRKCQKFELENTFMLSIPDNKDFHVEELINRYLSVRDIAPQYCSNCEEEVKVYKQVSYQPKVVIIVLKRYMYVGGIIQRKNNACHFPLDNFKIGRAAYKLWGISMHQGTMQSGHYTAACLNPVDGRWYEFNDEIVSPMDINSSVVKVRAYLLFYQIVDGDSHFGFDNL